MFYLSFVVSFESQDSDRKVAPVQHAWKKVASSLSVKVCKLFYMPITIDLGMRQEMMAPSSKRGCLLTVWPTNNFCVPTPWHRMPPIYKASIKLRSLG